MTDAGDLDILGIPEGATGYQPLARNAVHLDLDAVDVDVASLDDLISMKRASSRLRDLAHLEILGALRDEMDRQAQGV